jgi:hypothetical protein
MFLLLFGIRHERVSVATKLAVSYKYCSPQAIPFFYLVKTCAWASVINKLGGEGAAFFSRLI